MSIETIAYITPNYLTPGSKPSIESTPKADVSFGHWLGDKIADTNTQLNTADETLKQLATGQTENLHQSMIALEQAKLSFHYLEQIRNRLMNAYQDLLREQI